MPQRVQRAAQIVTNSLPVKEQVQKFNNEANKLIASLEADKLLKIPFVGGFNAGKSELLNTIIGRRILPTAIRPETAIAYEIYFSSTEYAELFSTDGHLKQKINIDDIKSLSTVPGDVAKVYVNSPKIKELSDCGITLVDMPGVNSGIEAHEKAINSYIGNAAAFFYFVDVQFGTLTLADIAFIKEFTQYGADIRVFLSKCDSKPESEVQKVRQNMAEVIRGTGTAHHDVGTSTAVNGSDGLTDVFAALDSINVEEPRRQRGEGLVLHLVDDAIGQFELQINLAQNEGKDMKPVIDKLMDERDNALASLNEKISGSQSTANSAEDIVSDVRNALMNNAYTIASQAVNSNGNQDTVGNAIMSIVKPVIIQSFGREMTEYSAGIESSISSMSANLGSIVSNTKAQTDNMIGSIIGRLGGQELIATSVSKLMTRLAAKYAGRAIGSALTFLNPVIGVIVSFLPDILAWLFGGGEEKKIKKVVDNLQQSGIDNICNNLHSSIVNMVEKGRAETVEAARAEVEAVVAKIDANIRAAQEQQSASEEERNAKIARFEAAISELNSLKD